MSEDDWFERAFQEEDSSEDGESDADDEAVDPQSEPEEETADPRQPQSEPEEETANPRQPQSVPEDVTADPGRSESEPFEEDFATAFRNSPGPNGVGGPDRTETESFDEEDFESALERIDLGIEGLDEMIRGGVPERSLMVVIGSAGTGKTTFALQFLREALIDGERAVYITLEESRSQLLNTADEKGWEFDGYVQDETLAVLGLDPVEMANSLASIRNDLPRLVSDFGADRLVLDSVSLLEMMYDRRAQRRSEVFEFTRALKDAGVTTMVTSEADAENPYSSRYGIVEYLSDAVFVLQYVRPDDFGETRLAVEIQKIRDASHAREPKPYEITDDGISVYRRANIF